MARLKDGHKTLITCTGFATAALAVTSVKPPGYTGGGGTDVTTMLNDKVRTMSPKELLEISDASFSATYDPAILSLDDIAGEINVNQEWTLTFPDGATFVWWGWLDTLEPGELEEGGLPTVEGTIKVGNLNDLDAETPPVVNDPTA